MKAKTIFTHFKTLDQSDAWNSATCSYYFKIKIKSQNKIEKLHPYKNEQD
jgi:hypothetical protein